MKRRIFLIFVVLVVFTGCKSPEPTLSPGDIQAAMAQTSAAETKNAPPTLEPTETQIPTVTSTPSYFSPAYVLSANLNMRTGPSTLFNILGSYQQGDEVLITGRILEGDWLMVEADRNDGTGRKISGWMSASHLDIKSGFNELTIIPFPEEQIIRGMVTDTNGSPINGARVATIYEPAGEDRIQADNRTGLDGQFVVYVPEDINGPLDIQIVHVACDSVIMEDDCTLLQYFLAEDRFFITIPPDEPVHFVYEKALVLLEGKVERLDGWGAPNVWVIAEREEDEVKVRWFTEVGGRFFLPLGEGTWEVHAVWYEADGTDHASSPLTYTITEGSQNPEYLVIPSP